MPRGSGKLDVLDARPRGGFGESLQSEAERAGRFCRPHYPKLPTTAPLVGSQRASCSFSPGLTE